MKGKQIQFKINLDANEQQKRDLVSSILTEIMPEKSSWPLVVTRTSTASDCRLPSRRERRKNPPDAGHGSGQVCHPRPEPPQIVREPALQS